MIARLFVILITGLSIVSQAQNEGTLYFMNSLPQSVYLNPAFVPKYKISIGLPGSSVYTSYTNNGFTYSDIVTSENKIVSVDLEKLYRSLKEKNYVTEATSVDLFRLSMKVNPRLYLTFNSTARTYSRQMLPKKMVELFIEGNAAYIGKTLTLNPSIEGVAFIENGIGGSFVINKDFTIGARIKWLKGLANVTTENAKFDLSVDEQFYAITATADLDVRTSGINKFLEGDFDFDKDRKNYLKNNGFGIDLGATYRFLDRINVSLSVIDLGSIKWKNDNYQYYLDPKKATYTHEGLNLNENLGNLFTSNNELVDSLEYHFTPEERTIPSYKTSTPTKIYLGGNYEIRRNFTAGVVVYSEIFRGRTSVGTTIGLTKNFGKRFTASGTYTLSNSSYNNIGLGASLNLPPFQLYMVGDNILRAAFKGKEINDFINSSQVINLRVGLNLVFGWDKGPDKLGGSQPSPAYSSKKKKLGIKN